MNSRVPSRRQTVSDSQPVAFTPKSTVDEYVKGIKYHAGQEAGATLYPGDIYRGLSSFIDQRAKPTSSSATSLATLPSFAWLTSPAQCNSSDRQQTSDKPSTLDNGVQRGRFERFADPDLCIQALKSNIEASRPQVLFLRGHPSPQWLRTIGAFCCVDPELFRWFLRYKESVGSDYYFESAPSTMSSIYRFKFYTIGFQSNYGRYCQEHVDITRAEGSCDFENYKDELLGGILATGSSIVRNFYALDDRHCVIEQEMDISILKIGKTWMAIACTDAGDDLSRGPRLPWIDGLYNSHTELLPIMQYRPRYSLKSPDLNKSESGQEAVRNTQSLAIFPEGYGRGLDWSLAGHDRFYVLEDMFRLAGFSQKQLLNLLEIKIKAATHRFSQSKEPPTLNNLLYFRDVLEDQIHAAEAMINLTEQLGQLPHAGPRRPSSVTLLSAEQKAAAEQAVAEVHSLFRNLRAQAQHLHNRCTQEMAVISNNSMLLESQRAMQQARLVTKLTIVAFVYLPFSFTAGFFGMNFKELGNGTISLWIFFAASFPLMLVTLGFFVLDVETVKEITHTERTQDAAFGFAATGTQVLELKPALDTLSDRWGGLVGGLVNASLGNTVELIVGLLAITSNNVGAAQSAMMGSILNDILLVQGICIIVGARSKGVLLVNSALVDSLSSLMLVASMAMILPTALYAALPHSDSKGSDMKQRIVSFSRATSIVLLFIYGAYLYFQHKTHRSLFDEQDDGDDDDSAASDHSDDLIPTSQPPPSTVRDCESGSDADGTPSMQDISIVAITLVLSSLAIAKCTYNIMLRLDEIVKASGVSQTFIALVIFPLASNAPELTQVLAAAKKQKIDFAIAVIVGSILQIALFVLPALVVIGWIIGSKMDLYFEMSQTCVLLFAIMLVNQVLQDRQYTYLHGMMFLCV
ncbi:hypothetical protein PWT90_03864 [Aphanocladium album]|nr:hypothetical protein PWT90_03864 [Aphanocladium album]